MTTLDLRGPLQTVHSVNNVSTYTDAVTDYIDLKKYTHVEDNRSNDCLADLGLTFNIDAELTSSSDSPSFN